MRKHIYIREADEAVWPEIEEAAEKIDRSVGWYLINCHRRCKETDDEIAEGLAPLSTEFYESKVEEIADIVIPEPPKPNPPTEGLPSKAYCEDAVPKVEPVPAKKKKPRKMPPGLTPAQKTKWEIADRVATMKADGKISFLDDAKGKKGKEK